MTEAAVPCSRCGSFIPDRASLLYSDEGEPMCVACREAIDEPRRRAAQLMPLFWRALGSAFGGLIGLVVSVFFLFGAFFASVPAAYAGVTTFLALRGNTEARETLGWRFPVALVASFFGAALGALGLVLALGVWALGRSR